MKNNQLYFKDGAVNIVFWAVVFILFLPIIVLPPNFQPSDWSRSIFFRIILTTIVAFLFFKFFYKKEAFFYIPKWKTSVYLPFLILSAFFATLILATVFSKDTAFSIFGSPVRAGGVLNLLFFFVFSILLALFINKSQWEKLFNIIFIAGVLASLLAIVQYFNLLKNIFISFEGGSTPSFLGNSTILAIYMLFLSFLSFVFFIQQRSKNKKLLYGALFILFIFTIFITGSRAAYLGLLAGFLYFFLLYPYPKRYKMLKITAVVILLFSMIIIVLFNFLPQLGEKNNLLKIIASRVSLERISKDIFGTRLSVWKITLKAMWDNPLLGWGPENFYIGFEKYYEPTQFSTPILLWDRPHNIFMDIAVSSGIFSLLLYIAFWITLFWQLQKIKYAGSHPDITLKTHGIQAMFIGYLVLLFFNFDNFSTYLISFFFIGYSFYLISLHSEQFTPLPPKSVFFQKKPLALAVLTIFIAFAWFWNIKPFYLNGKIAHAKNLSQVRRCKEAFLISNNENWQKSGIIKSYAILLYSDLVRNCAFIEPEKEGEYLKKMISLLKVATNIQPTFSRTWLFMASFTNVLAAREENADVKNTLLQEARVYLKNSLELSPKRQEIFSEMEKNHLISEDYPAMKKTSEDCIIIDPRFGECYWYLGLAQIFLNEQADSKKNIELAIKNGYPYNSTMRKQSAVAYMSQKNWAAAVENYQKVDEPNETFFPKANASYHATLAFLYQQNGEFTKAGQEALKVFRLQPENPETVQFIKLLLGKKPNDPILKSSLAFIYLQPGPYQEISKARAIYLQLVENYPQNIDYRWELIKIYYKLKEYDRAYQGALLFITLNPKSKSGTEIFIKTLPKSYWEEYIKLPLSR